MAYTDQELLTLAAAVAGLPTAAHTLLATKTAQESIEAIATLLAQTRAKASSDAAKSLVSMTVSDWAALEAIGDAIPAGTIYEDLKAAKTAFDAHDAVTFGPRLATIFLAAIKHFGI
jgi:hypothetical protein